MTAENLWEIAASQIGYTESPADSNMTKYGAAYGWNGVPWCVIFIWWCFNVAGASKLFYGGGKTASCRQLRVYAVDNSQWVSSDYRAGDIVLYDFSGTEATPNHAGIVESVSGNIITAIEGNTSPSNSGSQYNGGCVARKKRDTSRVKVVGAYRPKYQEGTMTGKEIYDALNEYLAGLPVPEWAVKELRDAKEAGITDGSDPMGLALRYQAAIMAKRAMDRKTEADG